MAARTLDRRRAGVLLHPTSLPGGPGNGDLGPDAYRFVDVLAEAGLSVWQMLPLGPTHRDGSPYQNFSVHAGNPVLVSLRPLQQAGWLEVETAPVESDPMNWRLRRLARAQRIFERQASDAEREELRAFLAREAHWLDDYALFQSIRLAQEERPWWEWPTPLRDRQPEALERERTRNTAAVAQQRFEQFLFFRQWTALKRYANERGILLFGDMPIFVAQDSAEVWARRDLFLLDDTGHPQWVAGVPPDYFSADGQRWGNPLYDWGHMTAEGFDWWERRLATQLELFDLIRIDHFRGFEACWQIPAASPTARDGQWTQVPGKALFTHLRARFDPLPLVAEDLGFITAPVRALRRRFHLPGMKVLQFAFDGNPANPYLPHNHRSNSVVYTGTHDNDTTLGWFESLPASVRTRVVDYLGEPSAPMPWPLVRAAFASVARLAVVPLQDLLSLGSEHRMNRPGSTEGNWRWRFEWSGVDAELIKRVRHLAALYGRLAGAE